jgi:simple sugar transport system ATP-binding protein
MLGPEDAKALFASLTRLASEGATIILVTHRLPEVFEYCSKVTILRAGVKVGEHNVSEVTAEQLAQEIVGGDVIERIPPTSSNQEAFPPLVKLRGISAKGSKGQLAVKKVDLSLRQGKIIGIAGVDGSGQRELFRVLIGIQNPESGSITYHVNDIEKEWTKANTAERIQDGLRIIPEDRHHEAVIEDWSLIENAKLGLQRIPQLIPNGTQIQDFAHTISERFSTKHGGLDNPMSSLSGGNQQRFVAARALQVSPKIILAFQPARGLDLNSTTKVYQAMREECELGASALVVSFDLDELLDFCDEIVVMCNGVLTTPSQRDRTEIGRLMVNG